MQSAIDWSRKVKGRQTVIRQIHDKFLNMIHLNYFHFTAALSFFMLMI